MAKNKETLWGSIGRSFSVIADYTPPERTITLAALGAITCKYRLREGASIIELNQRIKDSADFYAHERGLQGTGDIGGLLPHVYKQLGDDLKRDDDNLLPNAWITDRWMKDNKLHTSYKAQRALSKLKTSAAGRPKALERYMLANSLAQVLWHFTSEPVNTSRQCADSLTRDGVLAELMRAVIQAVDNEKPDIFQYLKNAVDNMPTPAPREK